VPHYILSIGASNLGYAHVAWIAPTTNTDGSALTGGDAIARYRLEWGTVIGGVFGVFINAVSVSAGQTSYTFWDLPAGTYAFQVTTIAVDGEESVPTFLGTETVA